MLIFNKYNICQLKITKSWKDAIITKNIIYFIRNKYWKNNIFGIPFIFLIGSVYHKFSNAFSAEVILLFSVGIVLLSPHLPLEGNIKMVKILPVKMKDYIVYQIFSEIFIIEVCLILSLILSYLISLLLSPLKHFFFIFVLFFIGIFIFSLVHNALRYWVLYVLALGKTNSEITKIMLPLIPIVLLFIIAFFLGLSYYLVIRGSKLLILSYSIFLIITLCFFIKSLIKSTAKKLEEIEI